MVVMRAAVYVRISRDDGTALGVARQEEDCRALAGRLGWEVVEVFVDNDTSAYSGRPRPGYLALIEAVKVGVFDALLVWHPDRLHRSPVELEAFIDVVDASGLRVEAVQAGHLDLSSPAGRMTARVVGAVARHESEHKSERIRRKMDQLAAEGLPNGGMRAFGFEADGVTVRESEAVLLRQAAERVLAGESLRSVVGWLDSVGSVTSTGRPWRQNILRRFLTGPRWAGLRQHRGEVVGEAVWPAILDRVTWERLRAVLLDPSRSGPRGRRYLLSGIASCGLCGALLVARPAAGGAKALVCASGVGFSGCGKIRVRSGPLDEMVSAAVIEWLDTSEVGRLVDGAGVGGEAAIVAELAELEGRLGELAVLWADGGLDRRSWSVARERIERRVGELRGRLESARDVGVRGWVGRSGVLAEVWPSLSVDQRRAVVSVAVERLVVHPAVRGRNFFDPDRVEIVWRR